MKCQWCNQSGCPSGYFCPGNMDEFRFIPLKGGGKTRLAFKPTERGVDVTMHILIEGYWQTEVEYGCDIPWGDVHEAVRILQGLYAQHSPQAKKEAALLNAKKVRIKEPRE